MIRLKAIKQKIFARVFISKRRLWIDNCKFLGSGRMISPNKDKNRSQSTEYLWSDDRYIISNLYVDLSLSHGVRKSRVGLRGLLPTFLLI